MKQNPTPRIDFSAGYTSRKRALEYFSILSFALLMCLGALKVAIYFDALKLSGILVCAGLAFLFADFASGFVHWFADTWGSVRWPLVGQTLIRSFREHHVDAKAITRHDFVETNGDNCLICLPILLALALSEPTVWWAGAIHFVFLNVVFWIFLTNQFHKWAHADNLPKWVRVLHRSKLILTPEHHNQHHQFPFCSHYCITSGWMNPLLARLRFFPALESILTALTGARPRADDLSNTTQHS